MFLWKHIESELGKDYDVQAVIIDGKRGLYKVFKDYPVQMCHFHQKKIVQRSITLHPRIRATYRSLKINLPYLFTYKNENKIKTYNTTNAIDSGLFSPIKKLLKIHNGFTKSLKLKMVDDYLVSYKKK